MITTQRSSSRKGTQTGKTLAMAAAFPIVVSESRPDESSANSILACTIFPLYAIIAPPETILDQMPENNFVSENGLKARKTTT